MRITIIGAGGVGGYFGAKLVQVGYKVTFLARGEHLQAMRERGLKVRSTLGDFHVNNFEATDIITKAGRSDLIILGVKAWQVKEVREELKEIIHPESMILPLQNGVLAAQELAETIDKQHILGGLCRIISKIESPGVIYHIGVTPTIVFGELNKTTTERLTALKNILDKAGIKSKISDDIEADLWKKFISICVSGLLAVSGTTYGELRGLKETREMMIDLLNEIFILSQKAGMTIESDFVDKTVSFIDSYPYDSTSSLTRDVLDGKPSEIEYQNGTVIQLGKRYGIDTPVNKFVYNCILPGELKARNKKNN